jgi:hypothetical protein
MTTDDMECPVRWLRANPLQGEEFTLSHWIDAGRRTHTLCGQRIGEGTLPEVFYLCECTRCGQAKTIRDGAEGGSGNVGSWSPMRDEADFGPDDDVVSVELHPEWRMQENGDYLTGAAHEEEQRQSDDLAASLQATESAPPWKHILETLACRCEELASAVGPEAGSATADIELQIQSLLERLGFEVRRMVFKAIVHRLEASE